MKAFLVVAVVALGLSPAMADSGSTYDPNPPPNGSTISQSSPAYHDQYTCTTKSKGKSYSATAGHLSSAQRLAVKACLQDGGKTDQCHHHLACTVSDGGSTPVPPQTPGSYYDWGRGMNGYGYCYQFDANGRVMNHGRPQPYAHCEKVHRSVYDWGQYVGNPYWYCFQWTPYGDVLNEARAVPARLCQY